MLTFLSVLLCYSDLRTRIAELETALTALRRERDSLAEEQQRLRQRVQEQSQAGTEVRFSTYCVELKCRWIGLVTGAYQCALCRHCVAR